MTPHWRTLERELFELLQARRYIVERNKDSGDLMLRVPAYDYPFDLSLTTFAKDLAIRLEKAR